MNRRLTLLSFAALVVATGRAVAQNDPLGDAFRVMPAVARRAIQENLSIGGFYSGAVDGKYGSKTRKALIDAGSFIADNSYGKIRYDLDHPDQAQRYITDLARGDLAKYLWGEGDEAD